MNYDFIVEELSSRHVLSRVNAFTPHRLFDSPGIQKKAAFSITFSSRMKARARVFSPIRLNPQNHHKAQGETAARWDQTGLNRLEDNFESTEGVVH
jgi:hypothetical protein